MGKPNGLSLLKLQRGESSGISGGSSELGLSVAVDLGVIYIALDSLCLK